MARHAEPIARIRLARSVPRLLLLPVLAVLGGAAAAAAGASMGGGGAIGWSLVVLGGLVALGGVLGAAFLLSVRLEVEESAIGLLWLGGSRVYPLSPGPVTRVRLHGPTASRIDARRGVLGWMLGGAVLRGSERIEVVRLAPTPSVILVPTERGRLAIAPQQDEELLEALSRAARARERLEAIAPPPPRPAAVESRAAADPAAPIEQQVPQPEAPPVLTGIERAMLEARLQEEREAAERGEALPPPTEPPTIVPPVAPVVPDLEPEPVIQAPPAEVTAPEPEVATARRARLRRPRPATALVFLPLLGAGVAWGMGLATGRMPPAGTDIARLTTLALVMAGPATSIGAAMALAWWPRLVGVVVTAGLAASVFIGRSLIGP